MAYTYIDMTVLQMENIVSKHTYICIPMYILHHFTFIYITIVFLFYTCLASCSFDEIEIF